MDWFRKKIAGGEDGGPLSYDSINEMAGKKGIGANGLYFYPYFGGGAYPLTDQTSKASLIGLDLSHDRFDIARAVMEGVAFQIVWILESFQKRFEINSLKLSGGATKSPLWCQMIADIAGIPVRVPEVADLACVGAGLLAGLGSGIYRSAGEGYQCLAIQEKEILPDLEHAKQYGALLEGYKLGAEGLGAVYRNILKEKRR